MSWHPRSPSSKNWMNRNDPFRPGKKYTRYDEAATSAVSREVNTTNAWIKRANAELLLLYRARNVSKELMELALWVDAVDAGDADPDARYGPHRITYADAVRQVNNYLLARLRASLHSHVYHGLISEREYWAIVRCFDRGKV